MKTYKNILLSAVILLIGVAVGYIFCSSNVKQEVAKPAIDYPSVWAEAPQNTLKDSWGAGNRECTSYVAYKIYKTHGLHVSGLWGDAKYWGDSAKSRGVPLTQTPAVGSVMWLPDVSAAGHLMWVDKVEQKGIFYEIHVSGYNGDSKGNYQQETLMIDVKPRDITPYFIHFEQVGNRDIR